MPVVCQQCQHAGYGTPALQQGWTNFAGEGAQGRRHQEALEAPLDPGSQSSVASSGGPPVHHPITWRQGFLCLCSMQQSPLWPPAQHRPPRWPTSGCVIVTQSDCGDQCFFSQMTLETPGGPALPTWAPGPTSGIVDGHLLVVGASHQDIWPVGQAQEQLPCPWGHTSQSWGRGQTEPCPPRPPCPGPLTISPNCCPSAHISRAACASATGTGLFNWSPCCQWPHPALWDQTHVL